MKTLVFVYGTLKSGGYNNYIFGNSKSLGYGVTIEDCFTMYDGGFPYVIPEGKFHVSGELFEVTEESVLNRLDRLEGVPDHFTRRDVDVRVGDEVYSAYMYVAANNTIEQVKKYRKGSEVLPNDNNEVEWV